MLHTFVITTNNSGMKPSHKLLWWTPRVLCILVIAFISLFAFDAFAPGNTFWQNLAGLLIHLIPSLILVALLVVAWKWELVGGIMITVLGLAATPVIFNINSRPGNTPGQALGIALLVGLPFIVAGILFIVSHYVNARRNPDEQLP